jgi:hypothetical protein
MDSVEQSHASSLSKHHNPLLDLQHIAICGALANVARILAALPIPSQTCSVKITKSDTAGWESWSCCDGLNAVVLSRMLEFWTTRTSGTGPFMDGSVRWQRATQGKFRQTLQFGHEQTPITPSLYYSSSCMISTRDSLLDNVLTLEVRGYIADWESSGPEFTQLDVSCLPNAKNLKIDRIDHTMVYESGRIQILVNWIFNQFKEGRALQTIQFNACTTVLEPLYNRFVELQVAGSITWE